jgi:two-component system, NtrC family, nitrogen regulation response regulator GlnG
VSRKPPVDATTVRGSAGPEAEGIVAEERALALSILCHPDPARVGEVAFLEPGARLSRLEPEFQPLGGGARRPLGDPHVSRKPVRVDPDGPDILELEDRIALLLHRRTRPRELPPVLGLTGESEAILAVRAEILRVAGLDAPVLVRGETGSGKELVARALHASSRRATGPFVAVNLAAVPPAMAASQLFGHVRGAFTGAAGDQEGVFVRADGGTLFLDEVGEVPGEVQPVLLRALDSGEVWPLGAAQSRRVSVRVVAATDADIEARAASGGFKAPLFHRLAGYVLQVPPLRERRDDVARLLVHFLRDELASAGEPARMDPGDPHGGAPWLRAAAVVALVRHDWPGNVRELRNAARRLVIDSRGAPVARSERLLGELGRVAPPAPAARSLEPDQVIAALREVGWKPGAAAAALGISKNTLYALMQKLPGVRKARDLSRAEILECRETTGGDLDAMAAALKVSRRGLVLRMRELELDRAAR